MVGAQHFLRDRECAPEERVGLGVAALDPVQRGQVVEALGDFGMLRPEHLLPDLQRALLEWLGLGVTALDFV